MISITHWFEENPYNEAEFETANLVQLPRNTYRVATSNESTAYGWLRLLNTAILKGDAVEKFSCNRETRDGVGWFAFEFTLFEGKLFFLAD